MSWVEDTTDPDTSHFIGKEAHFLRIDTGSFIPASSGGKGGGGKKVEVVKVEVANVEVANVEVAKVEVAKVEVAKVEVAKGVVKIIIEKESQSS